METLKQKLSETIKAAMKGGLKERLQYARNLHAAIRKKEIDDRVDCDDAAVIKIAHSCAKQRLDSIEQFKAGGRQDLVDNEQAELTFLQEYLPVQLSDDALSQLVIAAIQESGATSAKEMGKVMKILLPKVQGQADGARVTQVVKANLPN